MSTISYENNKGTGQGVGGRGRDQIKFCNLIAEELWVWCISQSMWVSAAHIPEAQNTEAENFPQ